MTHGEELQRRAEEQDSYDYPYLSKTVHGPGRFGNPYAFTTTSINKFKTNKKTTILTSDPDTLVLRADAQISSQTLAGPIYQLSTSPYGVATNELILSSVDGQPLFKIEYLGDKNSLYVRPAQEPCPNGVYPGFGELKYGTNFRSLSKCWTLKYADGKDLVLSCKEGKWIENASSREVAVERKGGRDGGGEGKDELEFLVEPDMLDRGGMVEDRRMLIRGLVVAAWVGTCWHASTFQERNEKGSKVLAGKSFTDHIKPGGGTRSANRFMGNLFSGGSL